MAKLFFPNGSVSSATSVTVSTKQKADIGHGAIATQSVFSVGSLERKRDSFLVVSTITSNLQGTLKRRLRLSSGAIVSTTSTSVLEFIAENQAPPPTGQLQGFNGSRFVRGDLIPVNFAIAGQKIDGLKGTFTAKVKNSLTISPLIIMNIGFSSPILNPQTSIETATGNFVIDSADTSSLPDGETEFAYNFKLTDGNGRVYTLESGIYTVYSL